MSDIDWLGDRVTELENALALLHRTLGYVDIRCPNADKWGGCLCRCEHKCNNGSLLGKTE